MADDRPLVLITGAAGRIGTVLRRGLPELGWRLRLYDRTPVEEGDDGTERITADIRDDAASTEAMRGTAAVVHLAGVADEAPFADICDANIVGTYHVFEAARRAGVERIVFASSSHAVGFTPRQQLVGVDTPIRPDTYYGLSKAFGEALARLYVDRFAMRIACLRIGAFEERPSSVRALSIWLSPGDLVRLTHACLVTPNLTYAIVFGISANTRGWWDLAAGRALGYQPEDDAEAFAAEVLAKSGGELAADDPDYAMLGGSYTVLPLPQAPNTGLGVEETRGGGGATSLAAVGDRALNVGLTGGIGSGKSVVVQMLAVRGAIVIDSDVLARAAVAPGTDGLAAVVAEFGPAVVGADGTLDRAGLAALVFAEPARREALERIIHPYVRARARGLAAAAPPGSVVVHDVPLLVEKRLHDLYDVVVVVDVPVDVQVERLVRTRGMSEHDARARIAAQATREQRLAIADYVLDNSGTLDELAAEVAELWTALLASVS